MDYVDLTVMNPVKRTTLHYQLCVRRNCRTWMLFEVHRYCVLTESADKTAKIWTISEDFNGTIAKTIWN
ncbi:hypothetical protein Hdeb2414_s0005g00174421 [Helianthus debilis subsp. tardiflorus]